MTTTIRTIVRTVWENQVFFATVFVVAFIFIYSVCFALDFIPETPEKVSRDTSAHTSSSAQARTQRVATTASPENPLADPLPQRIVIDALDTDVEVLNPIRREVSALDAALKRGVVRHPDSGDFRTGGSIFLFGHSSYLPTVHNTNYRAFNGIQKLKQGDEVRVQSSDYEYVYAVTRVSEVSAQATEVLVGGGADTLTLVTCNSFGSTDDRFVVEAKLVDRRAL